MRYARSIPGSPDFENRSGRRSLVRATYAVSLGLKPCAAAHRRSTFIAVETFPKLAITTASRYGTRPWRHSSTRRGSSQPKPTSTSIAVTNLRSASAASATRTTPRSR
jgi:hypothetical protein